MSKTVISIENLSKAYRIGEFGTGTFYGDLKRWWARQRGTPDPYGRIGENEENKRADAIIWALKDVNFTIQQGEAIGIIGSNGAGKSTLLRILSRVTVPTSGVVKVKGRIASLLEVGTGFHPELTGRENIFLNAAIMGMTRAEVDRKFDEIVDFSGVEQFIDTPVKRYSSGMYVRLAFAVAAHLEPEILIVDEVLAVGDAQFQRKCLGKMDDTAKGGRTVLFVSHNMSSISHLCDTVVWVDKGQVTMQAATEEVISAYLNREAPSVVGHKEWMGGLSQPGVEELMLNEVSIIDSNNQVTSSVSAQKPFSICIKYTIKKQLPYCRVGFDLLTDNGDVIFESFDSDDARYAGPRQAGEYASYCVIPGNFLNTKKYFVSVYAGMPGIKYLAGAVNTLTFDVENDAAVGSHLPDFGRRGSLRPKLEWYQTSTSGENVYS